MAAPFTQTEAAKYSVNAVKKGLIQEVIKVSQVFRRIPFMDVIGNALQYTRENAMPTASFFSPNEVWTEDEHTTTQVTATLTILGGDADLDLFLQKTRSNFTNLEATIIAEKAKAVVHKFMDTFWYGDTSNDSKSFNGLHVLMASMSGQIVENASGGSEAAAKMVELDEMLDVLRFPPDIIATTRAVRRRVNAYIRANGGMYQHTKDEFGKPIQLYNDAPFVFDDHLVDTEAYSGTSYSAKTGGAGSSIFALHFGSDGVMGLQADGGMKTIRIGQVQDKNAIRTRIRWYPSLAVFSTKSVGKYDGLDSTADVTA